MSLLWLARTYDRTNIWAKGWIEDADAPPVDMATDGTLLESFPDSPVTTAALSDLEATDAIRTAIPLTSEAHGPKELSELVVIQTDSAAIVASYTDSEGWTVDHRVDGTDRDPSAVLEDAMIAGQGDSSLVDAPEK